MNKILALELNNIAYYSYDGNIFSFENILQENESKMRLDFNQKLFQLEEALSHLLIQDI
ncbi:hypothetical protein [Myroides sp. LoEW2-1]|uniref:hypothetical protein n=1 Tax=Myroides sp. LoEW2-1 TaxID=2683192 RepID=UPI00132784BA|nr:hypothetical protein [Myroides sp. LoEW2-1]MVX34840.1 hypothetical protein [Myroides sp. LoEW2-1]